VPFPPTGYPFEDGDLITAQIFNDVVTKIDDEFEGATGPQGIPGDGVWVLAAADPVPSDLPANTLILRRP
jgi:hypothetical protein